MRQNKPRMLVYSLALIGASHQACAATGFNWVGRVSAGPVWANQVETQNLYLTPTIEKTYTVDKMNQSIFQERSLLGCKKP